MQNRKGTAQTPDHGAGFNLARFERTNRTIDCRWALTFKGLVMVTVSIWVVGAILDGCPALKEITIIRRCSYRDLGVKINGTLHSIRLGREHETQ